jgi:extracellular elastinolytic metalloproteinase
MRMYVWNTANPYRDGDFESGIIIHEYAHGISTRLTGGPANSGCLGWGEAGGMGEGWGDFFATALRMRPEYNDTMEFGMGSYAMNNPKGIRKFVYSRNMNTNPSTYSYVRKFAYIGVHAKGKSIYHIIYHCFN